MSSSERFDATRLAGTLDGMADRRTKPGTLPALVAEIETVRTQWPKTRKYPECVWVAAFRRHLADNPRDGRNRRARFARTWVHDLLDQESSEASDLIRAWLDYRRDSAERS